MAPFVAGSNPALGTIMAFWNKPATPQENQLATERHSVSYSNAGTSLSPDFK